MTEQLIIITNKNGESFVSVIFMHFVLSDPAIGYLEGGDLIGFDALIGLYQFGAARFIDHHELHSDVDDGRPNMTQSRNDDIFRIHRHRLEVPAAVVVVVEITFLRAAALPLPVPDGHFSGHLVHGDDRHIVFPR